MRAIKFFFVLALLLCLTEQCLVEAHFKNDASNGRIYIRFAGTSFLYSHILAENVLDISIIFSS